MTLTCLITGATDGIGLAAAQRLATEGHKLLIHGRSAQKLAAVQAQLSALPGAGRIDTFQADFSDLAQVSALAEAVAQACGSLDVLINNAGVYKTATPRTPAGLDVRFVVNTLAPALLTSQLLAVMPQAGRVVNLSSAAQAPVDLTALPGEAELDDMPAYAQSKLALTMWSACMAERHVNGPLFVAVNPGSLLNTNMVKLGWGGSDRSVEIGAQIVVDAAVGASFEGRSGAYFDNDSGRFAQPHPDARDADKVAEVVTAIESLIG